jgi:4-methylaminobutanoate oxidase (formaldehyde-forming)
MTFDRQARIVVIGGGAIGCAVAYALALKGARDVLLLEKRRLTEGCTWHAAGLVGQLRGKRNLTRLMQASVAVFDRLAAETNNAIQWHKVGSLRLASSPGRWSEIRRSMSQARSFGVECHSLSAGEAKTKFPFITTEGVEGAAFIAGDGYVDPYALTQAYAKAARAGGVVIEEGVTVTGIAVEGRRAAGVVTDRGSIGCDILVNCAGLWARRVGRMAGVAIAAGVVEHQYFLTEKTLALPADLTTLRDPDKNFYLKPDTGAFAVGGWEEGTRGCWRGLPPLDFGRELFDPDYGRLGLFATPAAERLPVLNQTGIRTVINGPIPVSADGEPIIGKAPELDNFYLACGFTAGIAASGGAGEALANWILEGDPGMDLWQFDVRRFGPVQSQGRYLEARAIEAYGAYYKIHWPNEEQHSARPLRRSPLFHRLEAAGAVNGQKFGWERPNWFGAPGEAREDAPGFEQKPNWFAAVAREVEAIRNRVALIDQTSFAKFEITGAGAHAALDRLAANKVPDTPGQAVYTQLCNERGGIEADLTIAHVAPGRLLVVTGSGFGVRDGAWIRAHLPSHCAMAEVTGQYATINICGPGAREVLQSVSDTDVGNAAHPFLAALEVEIGHATALAIRIGYVGELGFELYVPQEVALHVYDTLWAAGQGHGIANAGYRAIESCRLEKGYLYWSGDITPDTNPYEAGLGFAVDLGKDAFVGKAALAAIKRDGPSRRLATFTLEGFVPLFGGEPVIADGEVVGQLSSAGYGHHLGRSIGFGYLPASLGDRRDFLVEAFGRTHAATRGPRVLYDPRMERLKA